MIKFLRISALLLLGSLLFACGGGGSNDDGATDSTEPAIKAVSVDKASFSVKSTEDSSQIVTLELAYDDDSFGSLDLNVSWDSENHSFSLSGDAIQNYQLELIENSQNPTEKTLRITETTSQNNVDILVDIEDVVDLIEAIALSVDSSELNVGEDISLGISIDFASGDSVQTLLTGMSCSLLEGDGVISVSDDCQIAALTEGNAKVSLDVPEDLLATDVELPVLEFSVLPLPAVLVITETLISISSNKFYTGDSGFLKINAIFSDDSVKDVTSQITCKLASGNNIELDQQACTFDAISSGEVSIAFEWKDASGNSYSIEKFTFTVVEPQITQISLSASQNSLFVGESANITVIANYDDGRESIDVTSLVKCVSANNSSVIYEDCIVQSSSQGVLEISAEPINSQSIVPTINTVSINVNEPQVTNISLNVEAVDVVINESSNHDLILTKSFDFGADEVISLVVKWQHVDQSFLVTDDAGVNFTVDYNLNTSELSITDSSSDKTVGLDIVLDYGANVVSDLYFESANMELISGTITPIVVKAKLTDGRIENYNNFVDCSLDYFSTNGKIILENGCDSLKAMIPGVYQIDLALKAGVPSVLGLSTQPLHVTVVPENIGNLNDTTSFSLFRTVETSGIAFEISGADFDTSYKSKLSSSIALPSFLSFTTKSDLNLQQGCNNTSVFNESAVACGVKTSSDKIYIILEKLDQSPIGEVFFQLDVTADADIFNVDGDYFSETYAPLTIDQSFTGGHVSANLDDPTTVSVYQASTARGMSTSGGDYEVSIMFNSPYYQDDTVLILHDSEGTTSPIIDDAVCDNDLINQTITCTVSNSELPQQILIEIHGNGVDNSVFQNSKTAVDGEVGYDILITQNP